MSIEPNGQRVHKRGAVNARALILDPDRCGPGVSSVRDFSVGGLFVESTVPISAGEELGLLIGDESGAKVLRVNAVVAHVEAGVGFGARFVSSTEHGQASISRFADQLLTQKRN
jgi:hypothetical protein